MAEEKADKKTATKTEKSTDGSADKPDKQDKQDKRVCPFMQDAIDYQNAAIAEQEQATPKNERVLAAMKLILADLESHKYADWVEWLMGWPIGWTDLKPLETDKYQLWRMLHG